MVLHSSFFTVHLKWIIFIHDSIHYDFKNESFSVPLGFVCGYPVPVGELYGGSMFIASAANDTLQGRAIQKVNEQWGADFRSWNGRETIGISVCKKKYGQCINSPIVCYFLYVYLPR